MGFWASGRNETRKTDETAEKLKCKLDSVQMTHSTEAAAREAQAQTTASANR